MRNRISENMVDRARGLLSHALLTLDAMKKQTQNDELQEQIIAVASSVNSALSRIENMKVRYW